MFSIPPPRIMKVKRKKYEPLEVVFKDKARKIGDISTKAEKKRYNLQGKRDHYAVFFKKFVQVQRV